VSDRENAPLAVELVGVHKHFDGGQVRALDGLDLVVGAGEFVAVTGPSGCGKSTMLHLVAALDRPTSGTIRVAGNDLSRLHNPIARALANDPALLLADEPTGSLDEGSIACVLALFADLRRRRPERTIVIVTHDPAVAASADRTVYLRAGRVDVTRTTSAMRPAGHAKVTG
jgi:ABC-type lipoprotein export system ATPase subunit